MKNPIQYFFPVAAVAAVFASSLHAVETDPVGYVTNVASNNADVRIGVPLSKSVDVTSTISSVSSTTVGLNATMTVDAYNSSHFALFTSGTLEGQWFQVVDTATSSITFAEDVGTLGASVDDGIKIIEFWTLDSLFPSGGNVPVSTDAFNPVALVLLSDPSSVGVNLAPPSTYIYHDGSSTGMGAGWYDNNNVFGGPVGSNVVVSPEMVVTIRNTSGSDASLVISGSVPMDPIATEVGRLAAEPQDNLLTNPYPIPINLDDLGLISSGVFETSTDAFNPTDVLLVYDNSSSGINSAPSGSYIYHDGSSTGLGAGWYDNNNIFGGPIGDSVSIPVSGAMIVRKPDGPAGTASWKPAASYFPAE